MPNDLILPQFSNVYEGHKMRIMVQTLENKLNRINSITQLLSTASTQVLSNVTPVGNLNGTSTALITVTLGPDTFHNNGDSLDIMAWGTFAANTNTKNILLKFGTTTLLNSGSLTINGGSWFIKATVTQTSLITEQSIATMNASNGTVPTSVYTAVSQVLNVPLSIGCVGQGIATNDILQEGLIVRHYPQV